MASVEAYQERLYSKAVVKYAKLWGVDDLSAVKAVLGHFKNTMEESDFYKQMPNSPAGIYLLRATEPEWVSNGQIKNNPKAYAFLEDRYHLDEVEEHYLTQKPVLSGPFIRGFDLPHGGLNFIVSLTPSKANSYEKEGLVRVMCTLADVLEAGGRVYRDTMGRSDAVIVELPQHASLPVTQDDPALPVR